jgi:hypothetical protein
MRGNIVLVASLLLLLSEAHAQTGLSSHYTSLQRCRPIARLDIGERVLQRSPITAIRRCNGLKGWSLFVVDDDPRSWLVLSRGGQTYPLNHAMVDTFEAGYFPNITSSSKAEWRVDRFGTPVALIVRVSYQSKNDATRTQSGLFVVNLTASSPTVAGIARTNEEARARVQSFLK